MYFIIPSMASMIIKFLFLLLTASLIISCGAENDAKTGDYRSTKLTLNYSEEVFTSPSLFEISSNQFFNCVSAIIYSNNIYYQLEITSGYRLKESNKTICALSDLPKDIKNNLTLEITYRKAVENTDIITETFTLESSQINKLNKNSVLDFSTNVYVTYSDHNLPKLQLTEFDYSGGSSSMQYIFNNKFNLEFSESEVMRDLLTYGETENIVNRKGFSLLDMKQVFEHYGFTATGFSVPPEEGFDYIENDLLTLQSNTPFITPVNFRGTQSFITILKITNQTITFLHPHLGYLQIPFSELENGKLRNYKDWIILIPDFIKE